MKVLVKADHPILRRPDKIFDVSAPKVENEISSYIAELEHYGYENIEVIELVNVK